MVEVAPGGTLLPKPQQACQPLGEAKTQGGLIMGLPNRDELEGKFDQAKGGIKENVGRAIDDRELEGEGKADRASGDIQEGWGKAKRKVGETVEDIGDAIKR
jgi:uncharacterized protein YjbJ (UPF0337 family)